MKCPRNIRIVVAAVAVVALAGACGARVTDEQRAAAVGGGQQTVGVGGGGGSGSGDAAGDLAPGETPAVDPATGEAAGGGDAGGEGGPGAGAAGGGSADAPASPAPAGGNGGATDVGVTADSITLGTIATLSGPVPGLFQGAAIGAQAFAAYANSQGGLFGRQFKVIVRDDQFDAGQHRAQAQDLSDKVFAFLGSFSTFDDAAVPVMQKAGIPDVGYGLSEPRRDFPLNFSIQPAKGGTFRTGGFLYFKQKFPGAVTAVGTIYGDVPASKGPALDSMAAAESVGWKFVYERGYQPTETDFTADVIRMRQAGVKAFYSTSADAKTFARIVRAMEQQNFRPEFIGLGASGYDPAFIALAGAAAENVFVDQQLALYHGQDAATVPEVGLMNQWMKRVKPGYTPDLFATYAWASGRLLLQALQSVGPQATREAVIAALKKVDNFDANGLIAPAGPGTKRQPTCNLFMQVKGGKFTRLEPRGRGFVCGGSIFSR